MIPIPLQTLCKTRILIHQNLFRYVRSIARHKDVAPKMKTLEGKVKTMAQNDDSPRLQSYKDFITDIKNSDFGDELEVEKQFLNEDFHGDVFDKCDVYHSMHLNEERQLRQVIRKKIVGHKYFKMDRETTLLTHAAKEQIRYLNKSNPTLWNPKSLSECFPISENGVKKLLRSNFVQTCPERIKQHDEEVAKKWEILKSGKFSDKIAPLTQKLYKEDKLVDDYFSGNPNLPTVPPPDKKIIEIKKKEKIGEFSKIVKSYIDYQNTKLLESRKDNSGEKQVLVRDNDINVSKNWHLKDHKNYKYYSEEKNPEHVNPEVYPSSQRKIKYNIGDIPFSQFKENLKEKTSYKMKSKYKDEYDDFVMEETSKTEKVTRSEPVNAENCFFTIPKYEKENVDAMYERRNADQNVYKYDENVGYQYPVGKNIKGRIRIPSKDVKGKCVKVGQCVYDADGEFLYRVPS